MFFSKSNKYLKHSAHSLYIGANPPETRYVKVYNELQQIYDLQDCVQRSIN